MSFTLGVDHGTQAVRFCILPAHSSSERTLFEINRKKLLKVSALGEIERYIPLKKIKLVGLTYSMGDGIDKITDIKKIKNRGVLEEKTGEYIGGGTKVFDDIAASGLRAVVIPGLHRNIKVLDPRFRALYSHCASAEKVSLGYHCYLEAKAENIIISDISSNTVTIGIRDGKFFGAIDACLGAIGILHGPLDLEAIRKIDAGKISANEAFYSSGAVKIYRDAEGILSPKNSSARLALEALILSAKMEIFSFLGGIEPEAIVITGSAGAHKNVFAKLKKSLEKIAPVFKINGYAAAIGSAEIARDMLLGKKEFLGIKSALE